MNVTILVFSPSGHTFAIMKNLKDELTKRDLQVQLLNLTGVEELNKDDLLKKYLEDNVVAPQSAYQLVHHMTASWFLKTPKIQQTISNDGKAYDTNHFEYFPQPLQDSIKLHDWVKYNISYYSTDTCIQFHNNNWGHQ